MMDPRDFAWMWDEAERADRRARLWSGIALAFVWLLAGALWTAVLTGAFG